MTPPIECGRIDDLKPLEYRLTESPKLPGVSDRQPKGSVKPWKPQTQIEVWVDDPPNQSKGRKG